MFKKYLFIFLVLAFIASCQKQEIKHYPVVSDYGYFPLDSGMWRQYDVTFIEIDDTTNRYDTVRYQLFEKHAGWFLNAANDSMMRIERLYRDSSHHSWKPFGVWQAGIKGNDALQIEENIKFLKLKFPVQLDFDWNGNIYNRIDTLEQYRYTITSLDNPEAINNLPFDSVLTVTQKDFVSLINKLNFFEKYAYGIGLIEKQQIDIYSKDADGSIPIENRVDKGTFYYQTITNYGTY